MNVNIYDSKYKKQSPILNMKMKGQYRFIFNYIKSQYPKNINILEIGCGRGNLLNKLNKNGFNVYGAEISTKAIEICQEKGLCVYKIDLSKSLYKEWEQKFDIIILVEVLEHVFDFFSLLYNSNKILKKNGEILITTPNFNYFQYLIKYIQGKTSTELQNLGHIRYFSKDYLSKILNIQGFHIDELRTWLLENIPTNQSVYNKYLILPLIKLLSKIIPGPCIFARGKKTSEAKIPSLVYIFETGKKQLRSMTE